MTSQPWQWPINYRVINQIIFVVITGVDPGFFQRGGCTYERRRQKSPGLEKGEVWTGKVKNLDYFSMAVKHQEYSWNCSKEALSPWPCAMLSSASFQWTWSDGGTHGEMTAFRYVAMCSYI